MAKLIALASSDWHFHDWKQFNETGERTQVTINFMVDLFNQAEITGLPILFGGDLFHTPKGLSTKTLALFNRTMSNVLSHYKNLQIIGISGNHDIDKDESLWIAACEAFPQIFFNADYSTYNLGDIQVLGLPYRKRNAELVENIKTLSGWKGKKILLIHTELYGAPDPSGYTPEPQNLPRDLFHLFKGFNLVLAGHVHKHTRVGNDIYMIGAPNQQRKSDAGCDFGHLEIYDDFSVKFIKYNAPGFRYYKEGEGHEDTNDFWIEIPQPKKLKKHSEAEFKPTMDKTKMARKYAKETGVKCEQFCDEVQWSGGVAAENYEWHNNKCQ